MAQCMAGPKFQGFHSWSCSFHPFFFILFCSSFSDLSSSSLPFLFPFLCSGLFSGLLPSFLDFPLKSLPWIPIPLSRSLFIFLEVLESILLSYLLSFFIIFFFFFPICEFPRINTKNFLSFFLIHFSLNLLCFCFFFQLFLSLSLSLLISLFWRAFQVWFHLYVLVSSLLKDYFLLFYWNSILEIFYSCKYNLGTEGFFKECRKLLTKD